MTTVEFTAALGAHATWKSKLQSAIEAGKCDFTVAEVRRDDACQFGQWLHATPGLLQDQRFTTVNELHLRFHEEAARVL
ncbi:MAG: CZB domain-containing protein, partial [Gammaproteobacteria bacterium]|nr:CZB domain-containing protein [Gammaproteobacteria bacterium]